MSYPNAVMSLAVATALTTLIGTAEDSKDYYTSGGSVFSDPDSHCRTWSVTAFSRSSRIFSRSPLTMWSLACSMMKSSAMLVFRFPADGFKHLTECVKTQPLPAVDRQGLE